MEPISIQFTPSKDDYVRAARTHYRRDWRTWIALGTFGVLLVSGLCSLASFGSGFSAPLLGLMLPFGLWIVMVLVVLPASVGRQVEKSEQLSAEMRWLVGEERVVIQNAFAETRFDWRTVHRVRETRHGYLLNYAADKRQFHFVPRRAFESPAQETAFRNLLKPRVQGLR